MKDRAGLVHLLGSFPTHFDVYESSISEENTREFTKSLFAGDSTGLPHGSGVCACLLFCSSKPFHGYLYVDCK